MNKMNDKYIRDSRIGRNIFPQHNKKENVVFKYDAIGLYSVSHVKDANIATQFICDEIKKLNKNPKQLTIMDGTGGLGGNTISFCDVFKKVISFEIDEKRCEMLKSNMNNYKFNNYIIHNINSLDNITKDIDVYFFDPPWGGPEYKNEVNLRLTLGNNSLKNIIIDIFKVNTDALIGFKLPFNYDISEFDNWTIKQINIKNIKIVLIFPNIE